MTFGDYLDYLIKLTHLLKYHDIMDPLLKQQILLEMKLTQETISNILREKDNVN